MARNPEDIITMSNGRNMLIATDKLHISTQNYGSVHASSESTMNANGESRNVYSLIGLTLIEFKNHSKAFVDFNLDVDTIKWIHHVINCNVNQWNYYGEKAYKSSGTVKKIQISRQPVDQSGNVKRYPWYISIEKGTGEIIYEGTLNKCKSGSYKKETGLFINLTDEDFWKFMNRINRFIEVIENGASNYIWQCKMAHEQEVRNAMQQRNN